jgi:hypothetical protein
MAHLNYTLSAERRHMRLARAGQSVDGVVIHVARAVIDRAIPPQARYG